MQYKIGLDIGIASVGWAVLMLNQDDEPCKIVDMGVRIFDAAEQAKTGAPLALPRRMSRGARRRLRRHKHRILRIKYLIDSLNIMQFNDIDKLYEMANELLDIYQVRFEALERKLDKDEFVRLLLHLAQRRGFKSNRKVDSEDKSSESGLLTTAVSKNAELLKNGSYRTIGEMLYKDEKFAECKRNKGGDYSNTFARSMLCDEIELIFKTQREHGNQLATEHLEKEYLEIYTSQRSFEDGPGGDSKYGGNQIEKKLGKCQFITTELRGFKAQYSVEYCNMLQKVNSIKLVTVAGKSKLTDEQSKQVIDLFLTKATVNYDDIRKKLAIPDETLFNISYSDSNGDTKTTETEKKTKLNYMLAYKKIKKAYGDSFKYLSTDKLDIIGYALSAYKNDSSISEYLTNNGFEPEEIKVALTLPSFSAAGHMSVAFCKKIIPFLEEGLLYDEACEKAGFSFNTVKAERTKLLPTTGEELNNLTSPVVRRSVAQTIKVINSIIRKYGESPSYITIETAREMANNFDDRRKITKNQEKNRTANDNRMEIIRNDFKKFNATGMDLIKLKLWEEQDGMCPYSLKKISREKLFEIGYVDIDHIVPYSLSFDDSYNNKVLVFSAENRQKGNKLPMQYIKNQGEFTVWVNNTVKSGEKKRRLLKASFTEDDEKAWKERNLNDTKYISRFLFQYIKQYLLFAENNLGKKETVMAVNGAATNYVRKRWGIKKIRDDGDLHHAIDAVVIGCITKGMIQKISTYSKRHELQFAGDITHDKIDKTTGEAINKFPMPYPQFRDELELRTSNSPKQLLASMQEKFRLSNYEPNEEVEPIFVSRMPKCKVSGAAHKDTIKSGKLADEGYTISKKDLTALALGADGEIVNYYKPESDRLLYTALKDQLTLYSGDAKEAFKSKFYKPKSDGSQGPLVKKVKVLEKATLTVPVHGDTGVADNDSMVRIDVFKVENEGYYIVPIYVADTLKQELPKKAVVAHKRDGWKEMSDDNFVFSLYSNDLIRIITKDEKTFLPTNKKSTIEKTFISKDFLVYYKSTNISSAAIRIITHDNTYCIDGLGLKSLLSIEKYVVDPLGNRTKVKKEKRQNFSPRK